MIWFSCTLHSLIDSQLALHSLTITHKPEKTFFLFWDWYWSGWRLMGFYKLYQNFSEITRAMWFIISEILYLRQMSKPMEEKRRKKASNFQYPCGPRRRAFNQAFQPSVNYSRQRKRTRTLSAITLHSSLPSVSNINVMAFIFSSRLWTREASLKAAVSLYLSVSQYVAFEKDKTKRRRSLCFGDQFPEWAFKCNCLKNRR